MSMFWTGLKVGWAPGEDQPLPPPVRGRMRGTFLWPEGVQYLPSGIEIDGAVYPLAGQPPVAQTHGWGDMAWAIRDKWGRQLCDPDRY